MGILDDFLGDPTGRNRTEKHTVKHDRWDTKDYEGLLKELDMLEDAREELADFVDTGSHAFGDWFYSLVKARPDLLEGAEIRADYLVNRFVMEEAQGLDEYDTVRAYTTGDHVAAALTAVDMEQDLEEIFDKLETQRQAAQGLQDAINRMDELQSSDPEGEARDFQQNQAMLDAQRQAILRAAQGLEESLSEAGQRVRSSLQQSLMKAIEEAHDREDAMQMLWGLSPGAAQKLPAAERIAVAKRMNNEKFRRIAKLFGPMVRMAFAEQRRKTIYAKDELHSVELGSDLSRILPMELLALADEATEADFYRRWIEGNLQQWHLKGEESIAKGGIIFCGDNSGSMQGDCEVWMKAVGLALLQIAKMQRRPFHGIHFGAPGEYAEFEFDTRKLIPEQVLAFAEHFYGGGTDFMTPLSVALDRLEDDFANRGAIKADIVFATDGMCGVTPEWLEAFKERQKVLGFKVYGISIGGHPDDEPLKTICDGRVCPVQRIASGEDVRGIFRGV